MALTRESSPMDPISSASAGMLAIGIPADRRSRALGLLSEMLDRADTRGRIRLDAEYLALERRLGVDECLDAYTWLTRLGVLRRISSGWIVRDFAAHRGPAKANAAAMATLRRHLAESSAESGTAREFGLAVACESRPEPPERRLANVVPIGGVDAPDSTRRRPAHRLPFVAGGVAAAAALLLGVLTVAPPEAGEQAGNLAGGSRQIPASDPAGDAARSAVASPSTPERGRVVSSQAPPAEAIGGALAGSGRADCSLPDVRVLSVEIVPALGAGGSTAVVAGTVTNPGIGEATLTGVEVSVPLEGGPAAHATALLAASILAPGASAPFTALVPVGVAVPADSSPRVELAGWSPGDC